MKVLKNIFILVIVLVLSWGLSPFIGELYDKTFLGPASGGFSTLDSLVGLPLAFIFLVPLLFTIFGDKHKKWWMIILLIPPAAFEFSVDLKHIYFPIALGLLGWLIGLGILRVWKKKKDMVE